MRWKVLLAAMIAAVCAFAPVAQGKTLRWARSSDALTLDPHAQNEGPTHTLSHQIYEPLLQRDMSGAILPALATSWTVMDDPTVWEFRLRKTARFHNGNPFTADDVVFSLNRAKMDTANVKGFLTSVADVTKADDYTVHIHTKGPNPILPAQLTNIFIMDEEWSREHGVETPQNFASGEVTYAAEHTNGTGAFILSTRIPDEKTVLEQNPDYWGKGEFPLAVTRIIYTPIKDDAARAEALLAGQVDFIQDVPVQYVDQIDAQEDFIVRKGPQNRTLFFGMDQGKADLATDDVEGRNPFAEVKVREAMNIVLDRDAMKQAVMGGQSQPAGVIIAPFVNGWSQALDEYPAVDVEYARKLMREAGYDEGFSIQLDCPNDRYVNDEAICQAAVGMLEQIGIRVKLNSRSKAQHFPLITHSETEFYLLGWGVPPFDSEYAFNYLYHTKQGDYGAWNATGYSNPEVDAKIEALARETDLARRNDIIADIWHTLKADVVYLPLHHQVLSWGMNKDIEFNVQPEDQPHFKFLSYTE